MERMEKAIGVLVLPAEGDPVVLLGTQVQPLASSPLDVWVPVYSLREDDIADALLSATMRRRSLRQKVVLTALRKLGRKA
jgi:hypothetical protein